MMLSRATKTAFLSLPLLLWGCYEKPATVLQQIQQQGELVVVTRYSPTTYYVGPNGETGFEYDLARRFAEYLDVDLRIVAAKNTSEVLDKLLSGEAHLAAAGLTVTDDLMRKVRFGPAYQEISQQLVYRRGTTPPGSLDELQHVKLDVVQGSSHADLLQTLKHKLPDLDWNEHEDLASGELLAEVWQGKHKLTIANSHEVAFLQRFYPELRIAFDLKDPKPLAWALPPGAEDNSLFYKAYDFFSELKASGELAQITERYYGHLRDFDYVGTRRFMRHVEQRLPRFIDAFQRAGRNSGIDWRLLAAVGYQESHWNPRAVSPTGVRGIMMLTQNTARRVKVTNRIDPTQSILGGSRYFSILKKRLPKRILEPDRTWLALAAYNVGLGHLEDARIITQRQGGDPDAWMDVKKRLPLLRKKPWYKHTKHGYARGDEAVQYVENIRLYYDILIWAMEIQEDSPNVNITATGMNFDQMKAASAL